jgi:hypothetical protein
MFLFDFHCFQVKRDYIFYLAFYLHSKFHSESINSTNLTYCCQERHEAIKRATSVLCRLSRKCLEVNGGIFEHLIKERAYQDNANVCNFVYLLLRYNLKTNENRIRTQEFL